MPTFDDWLKRKGNKKRKQPRNVEALLARVLAQLTSRSAEDRKLAALAAMQRQSPAPSTVNVNVTVQQPDKPAPGSLEERSGVILPYSA